MEVRFLFGLHFKCADVAWCSSRIKDYRPEQTTLIGEQRAAAGGNRINGWAAG
jgi:hypothetical protein